LTRTPHDQFAKQYLTGLLQSLGKPVVGHEIAGEVRQIDVWFQPDTATTQEWQSLGWLGQMVVTPCLLEPFRNSTQAVDVRSCLGKLFAVEAAILRKAKRDRVRLTHLDLPHLWIFVPSVSPKILQGFGAAEREPWCKGIYFLPSQFRTALVAVHQLPETPDTLWLRLLGRGTVQTRAIAELMALPTNHPLQEPVLEHLANLQLMLRTRQNITRDERELVMNLSPIYQQWREATLQEGRQEATHHDTESFLEAKFGSLDAELLQLVPWLVQLEPGVRARLMLQLSREQLLARFQNEN